MKYSFLALTLVLTTFTAHALPNLETLLEDPKLKAEIARLEENGTIFGKPQILSLHNYYYTNSVQGERVLLSIPQEKSSTSDLRPLMAIFGRGGSSVYSFKKFVNPWKLAYE